jgi:hypothetical protein
MESYEQLQKKWGFITEEIWSDPQFREQIRSKIFDSGFNAEYDKTRPNCNEGTQTPEGISQT